MKHMSASCTSVSFEKHKRRGCTAQTNRTVHFIGSSFHYLTIHINLALALCCAVPTTSATFIYKAKHTLLYLAGKPFIFSFNKVSKCPLPSTRVAAAENKDILI